MIAYLRGYIDVFWHWRDHAAAHRNGQLCVCIARKAKLRRVAVRGCK